ncbi:17-beta-hydroxysteroid dehydrogenase type 6-like [Brevipalpus obovatus]|uniref:17-beta-hydroxysteroid dehydrogenase type 6-like n=1 Tax=Brevipalpus obovatus TaxID=246614 RepID=UPI003D9E4E74
MSQRRATCKRIFLCLLFFLVLGTLYRYESFIFIRIFTQIGFCLVSLYFSWQLSRIVSYARAKVSPDNKAVLITGCDTGFGHSLAQQLASLGYQVFAGVLHIDGDGAKRLRKFSRNLKVVELDVCSDKSVAKAEKFLIDNIDKDRKLWAIVNNAGIAHSAAIEWGSDDISEIFKDQFEVNTFGTLRVTRTFLPYLRKTVQSRVIIVSSEASRLVLPGLTGYSMTKHAVRAFGEGLRREVRHLGINVCLIEPGFYATSITDIDRCEKDLLTNWLKTPLKKREELGEDSYQNSVKRLKTFLSTRRSNTQEVIDSMLDSVTSTEPRYYYNVDGIGNLAFLNLISYLPDELQDFIGLEMIDRFVKLIQNQS